MDTTRIGPAKSRALGAWLAVLSVAAVISACGSASSTHTTSAAPTKSTAAHSGQFDQALYNLLPARIKQSKTIVFGALWETPPIIGVSPSDTSKPIGITPDLSRAISALLGVKPVWKNMQWPAQLPGLASGNVDALFGQVSDGRAREKVIDLVGFYKSPMGLLLKGGNPRHVTSMANACGLKIGIPAGSEQALVVKGDSQKFCTSKGKSAIKAVGYPGAQGAIVGIKSGAVDAWMDASASTRDIAKKSSGAFSNIVLPDSQVDPYMETITGIAVSKSQPGLSQALAGAMQKLIASGRYQAIMTKWGAGDSDIPAPDVKVNFYTGLPAGKTS
jgi:polar amino acid transport system substrate-binding protein